MERFDELATAQRGLLLYDQGLELFGRRGFDRRVRQGDLIREHHGLYRVAGTAITNSLVISAASLLFDAVGSIGAAGTLHGLDGFDVLRPEVTVTCEFNARRLVFFDRRVTVHRTNLLLPAHRTFVNGVPVTSVARTICDLSRRFEALDLGKLLDDAKRRGLVTYEEVAACREDMRAQGRRRTRVLDEALEARGFGFDPGESEPELKVRTWLEDAGLAPEVQVEVVVAGKPRRLDLAFPEVRVAVEYQGLKAHALPAAVIDDSRKVTELQLAGWIVVLITKGDSRTKAIQMVRDALAMRRKGDA